MRVMCAWSACVAAVEILKNYIPKTLQDDTSKVLRAFLGKLLKEGKHALISEIIYLSTHPSRLRQLRNFLVDAILKPYI